MTRFEFLLKVKEAIKTNPEWRYGQAVFNVMADELSEKAEKYRGKDIDPYYHDELVDKFIDACLGE